MAVDVRTAEEIVAETVAAIAEDAVADATGAGGVAAIADEAGTAAAMVDTVVATAEEDTSHGFIRIGTDAMEPRRESWLFRFGGTGNLSAMNPNFPSRSRSLVVVQFDKEAS